MALVDQLKKSYGPNGDAEDSVEESADDGMAVFDEMSAARAEGDSEGEYMALKSLIRQCMDEYGGGGDKPKGGIALLIGAGKPKKE